MSVLRVPLRINLLGAWSDQAEWRHPAAVINAAVGWDDPTWPHSPYPLAVTPDGIECCVEGVGTGLGLSSIRTAAARVYEFGTGVPFGIGCYLGPTLAAEREEGTKGGWQDPIGALVPGVKLILTRDHEAFDITHVMQHPLTDRLVLFDTGIRRPSRHWGEKVRALMESGEGHFNSTLADIVRWCPEVWKCADTDWAVGMCLAGWRLISRYFPGMDVPMPQVRGSLGHMLVGAGGGGYGVMFAESPDACERVAERLREAGLWAVVPVILPGATWATCEPRIPQAATSPRS